MHAVAKRMQSRFRAEPTTVLVNLQNLFLLRCDLRVPSFQSVNRRSDVQHAGASIDAIVCTIAVTVAEKDVLCRS